MVIIHALLPHSTTDSYHEVSHETLIDSLLLPGMNAANPYVKYQYLFEAEYDIGIDIYVPYKIHNKELESIYVIGGEVAEENYKNGLCLREAKGIVDISGHYEQYPEAKRLNVGEYRVVAKGENGKYKVVLWHDARQRFSLYAPNGMSEAKITDFIESLRVVD